MGSRRPSRCAAPPTRAPRPPLPRQRGRRTPRPACSEPSRGSADGRPERHGRAGSSAGTCRRGRCRVLGTAGSSSVSKRLHKEWRGLVLDPGSRFHWHSEERSCEGTSSPTLEITPDGCSLTTFAPHPTENTKGFDRLPGRLRDSELPLTIDADYCHEQRAAGIERVPWSDTSP